MVKINVKWYGALLPLYLDTTTGKQKTGPAPTMFANTEASEAIAVGDLINIYYDDTATDYRVRKASNDDVEKFAMGVASTAAAVGEKPTITLTGPITDSTLPAGTMTGTIFLGTAGGKTEVPPMTPGTIIQEIGMRCGTTAYIFNPAEAIENG